MSTTPDNPHKPFDNARNESCEQEGQPVLNPQPERGDVQHATVLPFPGRDADQPEEAAGTELERQIIDGEIVADTTETSEDNGESKPRAAVALRARAGALVRRRPSLPPQVKHAATTTVVTGGMTLARHGSYTAVGAWQLSRQGWARLMHGDMTAAIRQARAAGNLELVADLEQRKRDSANARWHRIGTGLKAAYHAPKFAGLATGAVLGLLLVCSIFAHLFAGGTTFVGVWTGAATTVSTIATVAAWLVSMLPLIALAAVGVWLIAGWNTGRNSEVLPAWIQPDNGTTRDVVPDENAILQALKNLGLPALNKQLKDGWVPRWTEPTQRDGRGWRTQLELPQQVTVEAINDKKDVLAHNLVRKPNEVWPTEPRNKPGVLDLWVADQGILDGTVDPWPLLHEGSTDFFAGVPVGIDARGDVVTGKLMACNYILGGTMGSGKTSLVINLLLGAMLDPLVELDVHVMAFNADYDAMRPRLRQLVKGDEDEHIHAALDKLRELRGEVTTRGQLLETLGGEELKLTRELAEQDARLRPRVVVVDECQELFEHDKHGEEAKKLAEKVAKKARKTGITLIWATPSPSAASLPRDLAKTASHRVCFAIGDHQGNDAVLGTGKHKAGITATGLVAGEDVGTAMASGFRRDAGLLRCHHIRKEKGTDEQTPIVQRALALRDEHGTTPGEASEVPTDEPRDALTDIRTVLRGETKVRTQEVLHRLKELDHDTYGDWNFSDLTAALANHDIAPAKSGGVMVVRLNDITHAITDRDEEGPGS